MAKIVYAFITAFLFLAIPSFSQNVGIGTDNPQSKLHITDGSLRIDHVVPFVYLNDTSAGNLSGIQFQYQGSPVGNIHFNTSGGLDYLRLNADAGSGTRDDFVITSTGKIGIGSYVPIEKLHVIDGNLGISGASQNIIMNGTSSSDSSSIIFQEVGINRKSIYYNNADNKFFIHNYVNGEEDMVIDLSGNIGIGTDAPGHKLEVAGNIKLGDNVMVEGCDTLRVYRNLASYYSGSPASNGAFIIHTNQTGGSIWYMNITGHVFGSKELIDITIAGNNHDNQLTYINNGSLDLRVRVGLDGGAMVIILGELSDSFNYPTLRVNEFRHSFGATSESFADGWTISQATAWGSINSVFDVSNVTPKIWNETGNDIYYNTGNVGIGTASPSYPLEVTSTSSVNNSRVISGVNTSTTSTGQKIYGLYGSVQATTTANAGAGVIGWHNASTGTSAGVRGETSSAAGKGVFAWATNTAGTNYGLWAETLSPDGFAGYFKGGKNYFEGRVGIGTLTPLHSLHIKSSDTLGSLLVSPNGTVNEYAELILAEDNDNTYSMSWRYDGASNYMRLYGKSGATIYGPHLSIERANGFMGIGTDTPANKLHVEGGDVTFSDFYTELHLNSTGTVSRIYFDHNGTAQKSIYHINNTGAFTIYDEDRSEYDLYMTNSGDVGLGGTGNPYSALHVIHDASLSDGITFGPSTIQYWLQTVGNSSGRYYLYHNGTQRGYFDGTTGVYTAVPGTPMRGGEIGSVLDDLVTLKPVENTYAAPDRSEVSRFEIRTEEVKRNFPQLISTAEETEIESIDYDGISVLAVKAIQEQQETITQQQEQIRKLTKDIEALKLMIEEMKKGASD